MYKKTLQNDEISIAALCDLFKRMRVLAERFYETRILANSVVNRYFLRSHAPKTDNVKEHCKRT